MRISKVLLLGIIFFSCQSNIVFFDIKNIDYKKGWNVKDTISFNIENIDTLTPYNLFLLVRNGESYPYQNMFLITVLESQEGKIITDTLEYEMASPEGKWIGRGIGEIKESLLVYKEGLKFVMSSNNKLSVVHAMRNHDEVEGLEDLKGIHSLGIRITTSNEENTQRE